MLFLLIFKKPFFETSIEILKTAPSEQNFGRFAPKILSPNPLFDGDRAGSEKIFPEGCAGGGIGLSDGGGVNVRFSGFFLKSELATPKFRAQRDDYDFEEFFRYDALKKLLPILSPPTLNL